MPVSHLIINLKQKVVAITVASKRLAIFESFSGAADDSLELVPSPAFGLGFGPGFD